MIHLQSSCCGSGGGGGRQEAKLPRAVTSPGTVDPPRPWRLGAGAGLERRGVVASGVALLTLVACGPKPPPPVAFVDSPAFSHLESRAFGVLKGEDLSVVVEKTEEGYRALAFTRDEAGAWQGLCAGSFLPAEDLDVMRWVGMEDGRLLLVVGTSATPDMLEQHMELVHVEDNCASRHKEKLRLPVPGQVVGPGSVPGGITVLAGNGGVRLVDQPKVVTLEGATGDVGLLMGVRARVLSGTAEELQVTERRLGFLHPRQVAVQWRAPSAEANSTPAPDPTVTPTPDASLTPDPDSTSIHVGPTHVTDAPTPVADAPTPAPDAPTPAADAPTGLTAPPHTRPPCPEGAPCPASPVDLPELGDEDEHTSFAIRSGESGTLVIEGDGELRLLEIWHGCPHRPAVPLELHLGSRTFVTGGPPAPDSFVQAAGRSQHFRDGSSKDLLALYKGQRRLDLDLTASDEERCIRQIKGYGFDAREAPPPPEP